MDLKNIKEELARLLNSLFSKIEDSYWFYFITEKYHALSYTHKKGLFTILVILLFIVIVYYPAIRLYASYKNVNEFIDKKYIIQELNSLSSANQLYRTNLQQSPTDLVQFLKQGIQRIKISEQQILQVQKIENQRLQDIQLPVKTQTATVELDNLNLTEIVQYGYQLENLSDNLKMTSINITENSEKENYFKVTYTLSFFTLAQPTIRESQEIPLIKNENMESEPSSKQTGGTIRSAMKPGQKNINPVKLKLNSNIIEPKTGLKENTSNPVPATDVTIRQPVKRSLQR